MELNHDDPIAGFIKFTEESLNWCEKESNQAVTAIMTVIDQLVNESKRISQMSEDTLNAINKIKSDVLSDANCSETQRVRRLAKELAKFSQQHSEIKGVIEPIIQCLQFQDRLTQNMQNINLIINLWWEKRQTETWMKGSDDNLIALGQELLKKTTMREERQVIRNHIPLLPEEQEEETEAVFF